ncbi:internal scaffolding protein [Microviridae sp.]|nr:internal scaffolding protein [Microviridae sp.]
MRSNQKIHDDQKREAAAVAGRPGLRKPYERVRTITKVEGESMTDPSFANDTDVNTIVSRFARTGVMPPGKEGQFADVSGLQKDLTDLIEEGKQATSELRNARDKINRELKEKEQTEKEQLMERVKELEAQQTQNADQPSSES